MLHLALSRIASAAVLLATVPALAAVFAGVEVPPPPAPRPVTDTYWGVPVDDPYRFLEETAAPEVQAYMKAQAGATAAILAKLPGRERVLARIKEIDSEVPAVVTSVRRDDRGGIFYKKREAGANQFKLYRRDGPNGT